MTTFTLDTNCIIALDEQRSEASAIRALSEAHRAGSAHVALVGISASERQQGDGHIENFATFQARLAGLGIGHLHLLRPMAYCDITFCDWCVFTDESMVHLERQIHTILFPNIEFDWTDYCHARGLDPAAGIDHTWRNAKCDVQMIWTHMHHKREVFVTRDGNFHKPPNKAGLIALGVNRIECPLAAQALL
jgi:hypothetical protein